MPIIQPAPAPQIQSSSQPQSEVVEAQVVQEPETTEEVPSNANDLQNNPPVAASEEDIVADPGLRIPIEQMDPNIRDAVRRAYISKGPCQPRGHSYPKRKIYNRNRSFHDVWFNNHAWLEYSIAKDAAFCFYCYLFKQPRAENFGVDALQEMCGFLTFYLCQNIWN